LPAAQAALDESLDTVSIVVYISTVVDVSTGANMFERLTRRALEDDLELCERCGKVCDAACRARTAFERTRTELLQHGRVA
jgi:hypothetical protein